MVINRLYCGLLVLFVQIVQALSFSFGRKEERTDSLKQKHGMLSQMGGFFSKVRAKDKSTNTVEHIQKVEDTIPTQLRSLDVKSSSKQWILQGGASRATNPSTDPGSIATGNINDLEYAEEDVLPEHVLQFVDIGFERARNRPSFFSSDSSSVSHLNALLLSRHAAAHEASTPESYSGSQVNATMAFKIEITHNTAEITVSVGSSTAVGSTPASTAEATKQATGEPSLSGNKEELDTGHSSKQDPLPVIPGETPSTQAPPIPFVPATLAEPSLLTPSLFVHNSTTHVPHSSNLLPPLPTTSHSTTADLSSMALFCFGLGVLCTYALSRLYSAASAWYRDRIPRYIAGLEKQSISLLSVHKYAEVKALLTRALPTVVAYKGSKHTDVAAFRHFLAKALLALGEQAAAMAQLRRVVGIYETYGEDLYMAHALEDLALAQQEQEQEQEHADSSGENSGGVGAVVTASQNSIALRTMRRALRIFTEEALAIEAIGRQTATEQQREGAGEVEGSDGEEVESEEEVEEEEGSVCYVSSPSCSDTTCDTPSLASSVASLDSCLTPAVFTIRSSSGVGRRASGSGGAGSALWDRDLLATVSDEEEEISEVEQGNAGDSSVVDSDSDGELHYSIGGEGAHLTHSLDAQDPRSPIYNSDSSCRLAEKHADTNYNIASAGGGEKIVLGELRVQGGSSRSSPLRRSTVSPARSGMLAARAGTSTSGRSEKKGKSVGKSGNNGGCHSNGSSPDNENTNPNYKTKRTHTLSSAVGAKSTPAIPTIYGTIRHTLPTPTSTPHKLSTPSSAACTPEEVSLRTALADLERLLAEPGPSPNTLIGPTVLSPESVLLDYSVDYDIGACGGTGRDGMNNMSTSSGFIDDYTEVYDCFNSVVKTTSNPLCTELRTPSVVRDLNELLSRTPGHGAVPKGEDFGPIECVKDPHVGRVLHRVASLLRRLGRHAECMAYLQAARSVYCMLHGAESEQGRAVLAEIVQVESVLIRQSVNEHRNNSDDMSMSDVDENSVCSVRSVGSEAPSEEALTPLTSPPPRRRGRKSKK